MRLRNLWIAAAFCLCLTAPIFAKDSAEARQKQHTKCQKEIRKAEQELRKAESKYGEHSKQAGKKREKLSEARSECW